MSWSEMVSEASEIHQSEFGDEDGIQYRSKSIDTYAQIPGIPYPEVIKNKRDATGWKRMTTRDFVFNVDDLTQPMVHGQILFESQTYVVIEFTKSRTSRWVVTTTREAIGESSRPQYRRGS